MFDVQRGPGAVAAEVKMIRTLRKKAFLVVEGRDDVRFWTARQHGECELVNGGGKPNVVEGVRRLDGERVEGVLGVVDDDYDSLLGLDRGTRNVITTGTHDLECLLCRSAALDAVLGEYGDRRKIEMFEETQGVSVREGLLERAVVFGRLRWAAVRWELRIDTSAIHVGRFVDEQTWAIDEEGLTATVTAPDWCEEKHVLMRNIEELPSEDPWCLAQGHDMVQVLRAGLRRVLGSTKAAVGSQHICSVLRAGISLQELEATTLGAGVREWETAHGAYRILRN